MFEERLVKLRKNLQNGISEDNFGLNNVSQRLKLHYGEGSDLQIESSFHKGTSIGLIIPVKENGEDCHV